ncbi:hypothetical protein EV361DRAFT_476165 [Lentinula raphanica]|nr:hypothetical protein EV361DRAFT_476165 [Lentinula raphanica]
MWKCTVERNSNHIFTSFSCLYKLSLLFLFSQLPLSFFATPASAMNKSPSERFLLSNVENHNNGQRGMKISDDIPSDESVRRHCEILQNELEELHDEGYLFKPEVHSEDDCIQLTNSLNAKIQEISLSIVRACCSSAGTPSSLERIIAVFKIVGARSHDTKFVHEKVLSSQTR